MEPFAEASCILRINIDCEACKMKVMEVLSSIIGVYSVEIDAKQGRVKIYGEVDPNTLMKAIARTGRHAKLEWAKLNHPLVNRTSNHGYISSAATALEDSYGYGGRRALPGDQYYPMTRFAPDCPNNGAAYYSDYGRPTASQYVPSYPSLVRDPYDYDSSSFCSIM